MKAKHISDIRKRMLSTLKFLFIIYFIYLISIPVITEFIEFKYGEITLFTTIYVAAFSALSMISDVILESVQIKLEKKERKTFFA